MEKILVTGSNGRLGGKLVKLLLDKTDYNVIAAASTQEKLETMKSRENISETDRLSYISNDDLITDSYPLPDIYGAIHLAFSRRREPDHRIAESINFSDKVFRKLASSDIKKVINISSQGVYGSTEEIRTEMTPVAPDNNYTMAKYATEVLFNSYFQDSKVEDYTSLRLDIVVQSNNLIQSLCKQAKEGALSLRGGDQVFSYIDENDAVSAMLAMLDCQNQWEHVYNVGWNRKRYTLVEVANIVADAAQECGYMKPVINIDKQDIKLWAGMETERFSDTTSWEPQITLDASVKSIITKD